MADEHILLVFSDYEAAQRLEQEALQPEGYLTTLVSEQRALKTLLNANPPDVVIILGDLEELPGIQLVSHLSERYPSLPVIFLPGESSQEVWEAFRFGAADCLCPPVEAPILRDSIQRVLKRRNRLQQWVLLESRRNTKSLQERCASLETLQQIGRTITASLDLDVILNMVVEAAVELTGAEEGSLLLLDETGDELYVRASRNFQEDFVRTLRLSVTDSLAGQVLRTGQPVLIDVDAPQKIKTSYLVYTLIYVPLTVEDQVIGVLEVDNRKAHKPFTDYHFTLISALADYASIAIQNARLYSRTNFERHKLETILTDLEEGVIVVDPDQRILLLNRKAREAFLRNGEVVTGRRTQDVIQHPDLLDLLSDTQRVEPARTEVVMDDGRVFNAQLTPIPEVGLAVSMQDITYLKELDRIKSDFVNAVSHDLRSPLTAILGYVELIERVGQISPQQKEFIRRIQESVQSITALINDLLDLSRIESGFDSRKESVSIQTVIQSAVAEYASQINKKSLQLSLIVPENLPYLHGNPLRLRQMMNNLVGNAIKYTHEGGHIRIRAQAAREDVILQVSDNGPGIPPNDQPHIFDKFYRASNVCSETPGTGLGLAIVKTIVDNHQGRVWVESSPGQGATFTVVLPALEPLL